MQYLELLPVWLQVYCYVCYGIFVVIHLFNDTPLTGQQVATFFIAPLVLPIVLIFTPIVLIAKAMKDN